ncbi:hypothetical protein T310_6615, partial [Rasamsonia emersonii CBS 393.64]
TKMKKVAPRQKTNISAKGTVRVVVSNRCGIKACSPMKICSTGKAMAKTPDTTSRAMMRPLDHEYVPPPHWRATSRQITVGMNRTMPGRSSFLSISRTVCSLRREAWTRKKNMTPTNVRKPSYRPVSASLMQYIY